MDIPFNEEGFKRQREIATLANEITELAGHLNAANYRFLKLIAEFDTCKGWSARALTRVACPKTEEMLLSIALHGIANHVETTA